MSEPKLWQTPVADDAVNREKGKVNSRGEPKLSAQVLTPTPSSTCSAATGDSPSPSRLWPTPVAQEDQKSVEAHLRMKANMPGGPRSTITSLTVMVKALSEWPTPATRDHHAQGANHNPKAQSSSLATVVQKRLSAPSASRRSSPMPVPCSPTDSLVSPTSAPFSRSPAIAYYASAVSSRLSSLAASPASPTAPPGSDSPEATTATSGPSASECFGSFDPALPSSRTCPDSSRVSPLPRMVEMAKDFFSTGFCQTWPSSGLLANGKLYRRPRLAHPTNGTGSGSSALTNWPTSRAEDGESAGRRVGRGVADTLTAKVREEANWLTPRANEPEDDPGFVARNGDRGAHCSGSLGQQVKREELPLAWPTASARDWKDTPGMALEGVNPDGSHRDRTDLLPRKVYEMERAGPPPTASGPPDPVRRNTSGSPAGSWATPTGDDANNVSRNSGQFQSLSRQSAQWSTPTAMDDREATGMRPSRGATNRTTEYLHRQVNTPAGKLNPSWVECLMGVPTGWTQLPRKFVKPRAKK